MTNATSWPWNRTFSSASTAWTSPARVGIQCNFSGFRSSAVNTALTPGNASAAIGRADKIAEQHTRQFEVVDVVALTLGKADILDALAPGAEALELLRPLLGRLGFGRHFAASLALFICSAAAWIALTIVR